MLGWWDVSRPLPEGCSRLVEMLYELGELNWDYARDAWVIAGTVPIQEAWTNIDTTWQVNGPHRLDTQGSEAEALNALVEQ